MPQSMIVNGSVIDSGGYAERRRRRQLLSTSQIAAAPRDLGCQ